MEFDQKPATTMSTNDGNSHGGSVFAKSRRPITLKFEEVVYKIKIPAAAAGKKNKKSDPAVQGPVQRTILKGISGAVLPGEMLAMMGPSGSGKTTLLTALGGRLGRAAGSITYNGSPFSKSVKRNIGFVTQDDVLYPHLTVYETLLYTALLRLPGTLSRQDKADQAEAVMEQLGLLVCRNSIVGGGLLRGVSGGERKRVSIGQELLINPSLLFLDEPTSGLDSTTALRIVSTLSDLTKGKRTIVMTIHQPSSRLFYMFNKVLLLSDGNPIYFGQGSNALEYFASIGQAMSVPMNPADFLLDLANGVSSVDESEDRAAVKEALVNSYNNQLRERVLAEVRDGESKILMECDPATTESADVTTPEEWTTSWWQQFKVLLERGLRERRHESFSLNKICQVAAMALLSGILWFRSGDHVQDQVGLLFFTVCFWAFYPLFQALFTFPQERLMLTKERRSGMYRLSSYFMARTVGDLPMELLLPTCYVTIVYWMGGLKPVASSFFSALFLILLNVLVGQGFGLVIGALVMHLKTATTLASVVMQAFMLAGGYYLHNIPVFIAWIKYIAYIFYSFKIMVATQFKPDDTYQCDPPGNICKVADIPTIKTVGFHHTEWAIVLLFLMLILFRLAAYLALIRIGMTKK